ncbi:MAG: AMP-binding protein [Acidimicrobiales bacterium]
MADGTPAASYNYADLWESVWPLVAEREALVCGPQRRTYAQLAERATRLANHLRSAGIGPGDRIGLFLRNSAAYIEAMIAAFSLRATPVNMNHRYTGAELGHLLDDSEAVGLLVHETLTGAVATVPGGIDHLRVLLVVDDPDPAAVEGGRADLTGAVAYEDVLAAASTDPVVTEGRSGDDEYLMYTGGTTGRPKGVLWRQEDAFFALLGGGDPMRLNGPVKQPGQLLDRIVPAFSYMPLAPPSARGGPVDHLGLVAGRRQDHAAARPPRPRGGVAGGAGRGRELADGGGRRRGPPGRGGLAGRAGPLGRIVAVRHRQRGRPHVGHPQGVAGRAVPGPGHPRRVRFVRSRGAVRSASRPASRSGPDPLHPGPLTGVFDDQYRPVEAGSGAIGRVANAGRLPVGYLNDPAKTAETFVEVGGRRYCFTGDMATVEADGTIVLLGRGSQCINTGGEKVFPEEVELQLLGHPAVRDVLVVGVPDERWGSAVTAVLAPKDRKAPPTLDELKDHLRGTLAGYKLPKRLVLVDHVERSPAGKADYRWAKATAEAAPPGEGPDRPAPASA